MRKLLLASLLLVSLGFRAEAQKAPADKELKTLVRDTLLSFNDAVREKSFAAFYKNDLATPFRDEVSLEKLTTIFQPYVEKGYDIADIKKSDPVFDEPPSVNSNGLLVAKGSYPTRPNKVSFNLKYIQEKSAWKLVGINVQVVPFLENTGTIPSEAEAKKLMLDSLLSFNKAIQAKNFDNFYTQIAKVWQEQTTSAKLKEIFQTFIKAEADISPIAKVEPVFDAKPAINSDNFLALKGHYPTKPNTVFFDLTYFYEDGAWKLVGLDLDLKEDTDKALKKPESDDEE